MIHPNGHEPSTATVPAAIPSEAVKTPAGHAIDRRAACRYCNQSQAKG